ncbi:MULTISPECIES: DUF6528 family protein [Streptacidiphilus]|uniref:DUF6528 family protein n=1 Tax=Streptacidiphilus cavernicola TaxID=3342716 RepID=A0ABV6UPI9_9ACTN|nr:DUF6528 family protein [Streptacidiphilus jeojiense]
MPFDPSRRSVLQLAAGAAVLATTGAAASTGASPRRTGPGSRIIAADQVSRRALLLDPAQATTRAVPAPLWSWAPGDAPGNALADLAPERTWRNVSEAKWSTAPGRATVLTCASEGLAAAVGVSDGQVYWAAAIPGANLHSLEWLPGGDIAVAASTAGWVRRYAASLGPRSTVCSQYPLPGAHGLHWDATTGLLWALGDDLLVALAVDGPDGPDGPRLTEAARYRLPDHGGHDLAAVAADSDRLWVTTNAHVHQFSLGTRSFLPGTVSAEVDRSQVKSIGDDPATGQILLVSPRAATPQSDNPCAWCTSTIELLAPTGEATLPGSGLYKARWAGRWPGVTP